MEDKRNKLRLCNRDIHQINVLKIQYKIGNPRKRVEMKKERKKRNRKEAFSED